MLLSVRIILSHCIYYVQALVNTFSCVLASDGERSYVLLMYSNISWTEAPVKNDSTNSSLPAWLGFSAGDGIRYTSITDTFSISVDDVSFTSNVNQSGLWIFRVDGSSSVSGGKFLLMLSCPVSLHVSIKYFNPQILMSA